MRGFSWIPYELLITAEGVSVRDEDDSINAGLEVKELFDVYGSFGYIGLRGGYASLTGAWTAGLGMQFAGFSLDYSAAFHPDLKETHRFTFGVQFRPPEGKLRHKGYKLK